ncbi:penicillin-binding protein 2 [Pseudoalteromonas sp. NBT06-2]|uniref:penicillin-binding protein 2 n=1 Tax=Pseudoalteromonas sp. NBT06-2 TaxID=2025950 RepID=UPI000BA6DB0C|nr:penicillin-binding protein 2 [Pseudoalteromonas sp. NBT06-2]PAJ75532.1 penicillin-binding protein 2 [Pseudoalteromonas sp. NBT06-2]
MFKGPTTIRDHSFEANLFARRAFIAFIFVLALVAILFINIYQLQVTSHDNYQTRSNDNRIKLVPVAPNRGIIYDRKGVILAENKPVYNLEAISENIKNLDNSLKELTKLLNISEQQQTNFLNDIKHNRRFKSQILKSRLSEKEVALFSVNQHKFPGFKIEARLARYYPYGDTLTHALGYVAKIGKKELLKLNSENKTKNYGASRDIGKLGIEKFYEDTLHGTVGSQKIEVNNRGRVLRTLNFTPPIPGQDLVLTLDIGLQQAAQEVLKGMRGAITVLDAKDGGVLAMYSNPSYDPNLFVHGINSKNYKKLLNPDKPLINRATQGRYAPASTVKPLFALLGLNEGAITETSKIYDPGFFQIPNVKHKWRDWKPWGHGTKADGYKVDVYKAIEQSCDTYFYDIAYRLGITKISDFMAKFGFGEKSGIDIFEETTAILPSVEWKKQRFKEGWYAGDTISVGVGQGYWSATQIQIANAINILANKGVHNPPHLVSVTKQGSTVNLINNDEKEPIILKNLHYWDIVLNAMHNTVKKTSGTAHEAFKGVNYDPAGKTGTAQVVKIAQGEKYDEKKLKEKHRDNAMYVGFAPFNDPEIIIAITVENTGGGSSVGAPMARKVMDYYFANKTKELAGTP